VTVLQGVVRPAVWRRGGSRRREGGGADRRVRGGRRGQHVGLHALGVQFQDVDLARAEFAPRRGGVPRGYPCVCWGGREAGPPGSLTDY
jgi:hypothetical protein